MRRMAEKRHPVKPRGSGERRLIVFALAVIAVAGASIGAMLALQYRAAEQAPLPANAVFSKAPPPLAITPDDPALPIYEEPIEPAALAPLPKVPPNNAIARPDRVPRASGQLPAWRRHAVETAAVPPGDTRPRIAIVIDDLGVDRARGARAINLPGPLTMAYLPYANDLVQQTGAALKAGHELLVHVPMEPRNRTITDPGPNALLLDLPAEEMSRRLDWNLSRFDGYVGINNHMGSRFTADTAALVPVMAELKRRGLLFLDSRTSARSAALSAARGQGVPVVARDVFIDHERTSEAIRQALGEVEQIARRNGQAIAIGHPRDATIEALAEWLPELGQRGFRLVPLSALVRTSYPDG